MAMAVITDFDNAKLYAEDLVKGFVRKHKKELDEGREQGDTLGDLGAELDRLRTRYVQMVSNEIGFKHKFFNEAVIRLVLNKEPTLTSKR
jgi:hypothetical protein